MYKGWYKYFLDIYFCGSDRVSAKLSGSVVGMVFIPMAKSVNFPNGSE